MTRPVFGYGIDGMWGPITDPGERQFSQRVAAELGVNIGPSPYRDYQINDIVAATLATPADAIILIWGTSLGANNAPITARYLQMRAPSRIVHGIWGFQASVWGAKAEVGTDYQGVPDNVLFAHLTSSDNPFNAGLGAYRWVLAPGNGKTGLVKDTNEDLHPGDTNRAVQDKYIAEMRRVIEHA